jgi:hypothetical protein
VLAENDGRNRALQAGGRRFWAVGIVRSSLLIAIATSCGARSQIEAPDYGVPIDGGNVITMCLGDLDCGPKDLCKPAKCVDGACQYAPPVICDDHDECTDDTCDKDTGKCHFEQLSFDQDQDGHRGPRPGFRAGAPGSCGDDCNDTSALAHPGATEVCDGVDNDCNGVVDDGAAYVPAGREPVLLSTGDRQAELGGIAFGKKRFAATFAEQHDNWENTFSSFEADGTIVVPATPVTHVNTDTFSGPIVWNGAVFGAAWEDRRDGDFEIYFNRLDEAGQKLAADLRVTNAPEFSLRPDVLWDGAEFTIVWGDRRDGDDQGRIYGQRVSAEGKLVGSNVALTPLGTDSDNPHIAQGETELAIVFNQRSAAGRALVFETVAPDLSSHGSPVVLADDKAASSAIAWTGDRYVVAWDTKGATPGTSIRGAALGADGSVLVAARDLTSKQSFARSEALLSLGDRLFLAWAGDDGTGKYAIYSKMITPDLNELTPPQQIVDGPSDSLDPGLAFDPHGGAGVAFNDRRTGDFQVYYTELLCVGSLP